MRRLVISICILLLGNISFANVNNSIKNTNEFSAKNIGGRVIYGDDNRVDFYQESDAGLRDIADSTAAMISSSRLVSKVEGIYEIRAKTFQDEYSLCSDEPFLNQPTAASCSAFLVGEDLVATAGHCIKESTCASNKFVFNYRMERADLNPNQVSKDEVYSCKEVVARELTSNQDYSLVKLDRPVRGHRVLKLANEMAKVSDELVVIGHPAGLPTKIASRANVRSNQEGYFIANLDTYGGNSGSAVFRADSLEVVGILVRGETDFVWDSKGKCRKSNQCTDGGCMGEHSTHISYIQRALQQYQ